jgi:hypothetical protein
MQQFKFRIWDRSKKVMCSVARISFGDDGTALTILAEPAPIGEFYRGLVHGESGILMPFTALKDKMAVRFTLATSLNGTACMRVNL